MHATVWIRKFKNRLKWELEKQQTTRRYLTNRLKGRSVGKRYFPPFTIGIVTYVVRFPMFKVLLKKFHKAFPHTKIVIAVNGYYHPGRQQEFLRRIEEYAGRFPNVILIPHHRPQALCRLWNEIILASKTEKIFIVNDDIDIAPHFQEIFIASGALNKEIAIINESWSHFVISKQIIERVGWFDERLVGVGGEDWDYEARLACEGIALEVIPMKGILNLSIYTTDFSFGENVERVEKKYTMSSALFLHRKWRISEPGDPQARFVRIWNNYVRLNEGFETPVFYDFALLRSEAVHSRSP